MGKAGLNNRAYSRRGVAMAESQRLAKHDALVASAKRQAAAVAAKRAYRDAFEARVSAAADRASRPRAGDSPDEAAGR